MSRWIIGVALLTACGSNQTGGAGGGTGGPGGGTGGAGGSGQGGSCCLNDSFYDCQSKAAFDKCAGFDVGACNNACDNSDFTCHMKCFDQASKATHDASSCNRVSSRDSECKISSSCVGSRGSACTYSTECSSGNCTNGYCYATSNGNPCSYSTQCSSGNCTNNCCSGNSKGSACTYSTHCNSGNCTNGVCK